MYLVILIIKEFNLGEVLVLLALSWLNGILSRTEPLLMFLIPPFLFPAVTSQNICMSK